MRKQVDAFTAGQLDVGFFRPLVKTGSKGISVEEIYLDALVAVIPDTHPHAIAKSMSLRELGSKPFILLERSEAVKLFDQIIGACQPEKFASVISSQPENMQTVLSEVASGLGVSIAPGCVRKMYTKGCMFIPIQKQQLSIHTELYYRSTPSLPP